MALQSLKPVEQPEPQPIPAVNVSIGIESATFSVAHGNGLFTQLVLTAETMQQVCKLWLESRKELMK